MITISDGGHAVLVSSRVWVVGSGEVVQRPLLVRVTIIPTTNAARIGRDIIVITTGTWVFRHDGGAEALFVVDV
jgi:hypothetical protein